ncbi:MAG: MFS transporter [Alloprevotella sp.]|nr:MFS transporter [Alloprevotella sp.]
MNNKLQLQSRLVAMNFLQFAAWGAYLTSMGGYLFATGNPGIIGWFYSIQGIVSIFMPALMGIVADRWIRAERLLSICHLLAGTLMIAAGYYGLTAGEGMNAWTLFTLYSLSVAFYMPTLALTNSVAFTALTKAGLDTVKDFPPIRVFGTVGFICTMVAVDLLGFQHTAMQFVVSGGISLLLGLYAPTLPTCPTSDSKESKSLVDALGLRAFALFKEKKMAIFFIFSFLLGLQLQISNGFANGYISSFADIPAFADTFGAKHANMLISLSQISETLCILLIPFVLGRFGIKRVMMIAMAGWVLRFGLFGTGDPGPGVWMFIVSCIVYGVAFDFFNISGALYVDKNTDASITSSAQGLFMLMTNGLGATFGSLAAQAVVDKYVNSQTDPLLVVEGWHTSWFIFAGYALVVLVLFTLIFKEKN